MSLRVDNLRFWSQRKTVFRNPLLQTDLPLYSESAVYLKRNLFLESACFAVRPTVQGLEYGAGVMQAKKPGIRQRRERLPGWFAQWPVAQTAARAAPPTRRAGPTRSWLVLRRPTCGRHFGCVSAFRSSAKTFKYCGIG